MGSRRRHQAVSKGSSGDFADNAPRNVRPTKSSSHRARRGSAYDRLATWYRSRRTVLRFIGLLVLFLGIFYLVLATGIVRAHVMPAYLRLWAEVSAWVLRLFGESTVALGFTVSSPRFSFDILHGCDAIDPTVLFVAAVLASPVAGRRKVLGLLIGVPFILVMNLVRVLSLFYVGVHYPSMFELMHYEVWQAVFIILSILCWGLWAVWAARMNLSTTHALA